MAGSSLRPSAFKQAEVVHNRWACTVESGVRPEHLSEPAFWAHVARMLAPYDRIEVQTVDNVYWLELLVVATGNTWAKTAPVRFIELDRSAAEEMQTDIDGMRVTHGGTELMWYVRRLSDNKVLDKGFPTKSEAIARAAELSKQMAA